jgi:hypothetical protein
MARKPKAPKAPAKKVVLIDKSLELPETIEDVRILRIQLERKTLAVMRTATDHLTVIRGLSGKGEIENLSVADPLVILIKNMNKTYTAEKAIGLAAAEYRRRIKQVETDAAVIAMTWNTETGERGPEPFDPEDPVFDGGDDEPEWFKKTYFTLPEPERDLTDIYEARLNVILNLLAEAGTEFTEKFTSILNNDMLTRIDDFLASEGVDLRKFQFTRTRQ